MNLPGEHEPQEVVGTLSAKNLQMMTVVSLSVTYIQSYNQSATDKWSDRINRKTFYNKIFNVVKQNAVTII